MNKRLTKRYILGDFPNIELSEPLRYERYYIDNNTRIQSRGKEYEKEILNDNIVIKKELISCDEFEKLKYNATKYIIRDSYLVKGNRNISIKRYYGNYDGLIRIEVKFNDKDEMDSFRPPKWFGKDITDTPLAFDSKLIELSNEEFKDCLKEFKE